MPEFILDKGSAEHARTFNALDAFTRGYIEALFFTSCEIGTTTETHDPETQSALPGDCGFSDLASEALAQIVADCAAFQASASALLEQAYARDYDSEQAGRDFWYTRNGHGVGYWDRDVLESDSEEYERLTNEMVANRDNPDAWGSALAQRKIIQASSLGERLSQAARACGESDAYLGDNGLVYVSP